MSRGIGGDRCAPRPASRLSPTPSSSRARSRHAPPPDHRHRSTRPTDGLPRARGRDASTSSARAASLMQAEFAQVNLGVGPVRGRRRGRSSADARAAHPRRSPRRRSISVPPFTVTGPIHCMPERTLREALGELHGRFLPVTEATYWSDRARRGARPRLDRRGQPRRAPDPGPAPGGRSVGRRWRSGRASRAPPTTPAHQPTSRPSRPPELTRERWLAGR